MKKNVTVGEENNDEDLRKPVHVLVDLMVGLLTKAPQFLRNNIETLFEALVGEIRTDDLENLVDVIAKPDHEYIEEI